MLKTNVLDQMLYLLKNLSDIEIVTDKIVKSSLFIEDDFIAYKVFLCKQ